MQKPIGITILKRIRDNDHDRITVHLFWKVKCTEDQKFLQE